MRHFTTGVYRSNFEFYHTRDLKINIYSKRVDSNSNSGEFFQQNSNSVTQVMSQNLVF